MNIIKYINYVEENRNNSQQEYHFLIHGNSFIKRGQSNTPLNLFSINMAASKSKVIIGVHSNSYGIAKLY